MIDVSLSSCRRAFCKVHCHGNYDTCTSLGTCDDFDKFVSYVKSYELTKND